MRVCPVEAWLRPQPRIDWVFPWMLHLYLFPARVTEILCTGRVAWRQERAATFGFSCVLRSCYRQTLYDILLDLGFD